MHHLQTTAPAWLCDPTHMSQVILITFRITKQTSARNASGLKDMLICKPHILFDPPFELITPWRPTIQTLQTVALFSLALISLYTILFLFLHGLLSPSVICHYLWYIVGSDCVPQVKFFIPHV